MLRVPVGGPSWRVRSVRSFSGFGCFVGIALWACSNLHAELVTFGTGGNAFTMDFVYVGDAGNADDTAGQPNPAGRVSYNYAIGKYEVRQSFINKYNSEFGTSNSLEISLLTGATGVGDDKPAAGVSWNEAARFVNWLNTSQGYTAAYKFTGSGVNDNIDLWVSGDAGYDAANPFRNSLAKFVLPSVDEWYKAAYYDPVTDSYFQYATGSNTAPTSVPGGGTTAGTAVYDTQSAPGAVDLAGGLSPFGTMGQDGNLIEFNETALDLTNDSVSEARIARGGRWDDTGIGRFPLGSRGPSADTLDGVGFRVVMLVVPEPSSLALLLAGVIGVGYRRWRR